MRPEYEHILQILAALAAGAILGLEREYHSKPAGFRTMILISVSSCLFTILSVSLSGSDHIAANIVTGIGFIGAGVVFKEGATVRGITSAAVIWMAAAVGMCIGLQHFILAAFVVVLVLLVMITLSKLEAIFDNLHQIKIYEIYFDASDYSIEALEKEFNSMQIHFTRSKISKHDNNQVCVEYSIEISPKKGKRIDTFLITNNHVTRFEV